MYDYVWPCMTMYDYICHMSEIVKLTQLWTNFVLVSWTCVRMIQNGSKWIKSNSKKPETLSLFLSFFHSFLSNFLELWLAKTPVSGRGSGIPIRGCVFLYSFSFLPQHSKGKSAQKIGMSIDTAVVNMIFLVWASTLQSGQVTMKQVQ